MLDSLVRVSRRVKGRSQVSASGACGAATRARPSQSRAGTPPALCRSEPPSRRAWPALRPHPRPRCSSAPAALARRPRVAFPGKSTPGGETPVRVGPAAPAARLGLMLAGKSFDRRWASHGAPPPGCRSGGVRHSGPRAGLLREPAMVSGSCPISLRFPRNDFRSSFTLLSEIFSSFPHGTCSLSVSCRYLALGGIHLPLWAALPSNPTRRYHHSRPRALGGQDGAFTLSGVPFQCNLDPGAGLVLIFMLQLPRRKGTRIRTLGCSRFSRPY